MNLLKFIKNNLFVQNLVGNIISYIPPYLDFTIAKYFAIKKALYEAYEFLSVGGIIVVDDCSYADHRWDGAFQAYKEFMREIDQPEEIHFSQLGVVRKVIEPAF